MCTYTYTNNFFSRADVCTIDIITERFFTSCLLFLMILQTVQNEEFYFSLLATKWNDILVRISRFSQFLSGSAVWRASGCMLKWLSQNSLIKIIFTYIWSSDFKANKMNFRTFLLYTYIGTSYMYRCNT